MGRGDLKQSTLGYRAKSYQFEIKAGEGKRRGVGERERDSKVHALSLFPAPLTSLSSGHHTPTCIH
jgi:hypothetical protein